MKPLLVVGSVNADLYVEILRLPHPGETLDGRNAAVRPGGKGANQAAAAAACCVRGLGAMPSMPDRAAVLALLG